MAVRPKKAKKSAYVPQRLENTGLQLFYDIVCLLYDTGHFLWNIVRKEVCVISITNTQYKKRALNLGTKKGK